jgi:hypothetical protein
MNSYSPDLLAISSGHGVGTRSKVDAGPLLATDRLSRGIARSLLAGPGAKREITTQFEFEDAETEFGGRFVQ